MTIEKVNALLVRILEEAPMLKPEGKEAEKRLAYIAGAYDMALLVKKQLESEVDI